MVSKRVNVERLIPWVKILEFLYLNLQIALNFYKQIPI